MINAICVDVVAEQPYVMSTDTYECKKGGKNSDIFMGPML
jgi:hypothetical protein